MYFISRIYHCPCKILYTTLTVPATDWVAHKRANSFILERSQYVFSFIWIRLLINHTSDLYAYMYTHTHRQNTQIHMYRVFFHPGYVSRSLRQRCPQPLSDWVVLSFVILRIYPAVPHGHVPTSRGTALNWTSSRYMYQPSDRFVLKIVLVNFLNCLFWN